MGMMGGMGVMRGICARGAEHCQGNGDFEGGKERFGRRSCQQTGQAILVPRQNIQMKS